MNGRPAAPVTGVPASKRRWVIAGAVLAALLVLALILAAVASGDDDGDGEQTTPSAAELRTRDTDRDGTPDVTDLDDDEDGIDDAEDPDDDGDGVDDADDPDTEVLDELADEADGDAAGDDDADGTGDDGDAAGGDSPVSSAERPATTRPPAPTAPPTTRAPTPTTGPPPTADPGPPPAIVAAYVEGFRAGCAQVWSIADGDRLLWDADDPDATSHTIGECEEQLDPDYAGGYDTTADARAGGIEEAGFAAELISTTGQLQNTSGTRFYPE